MYISSDVDSFLKLRWLPSHCPPYTTCNQSGHRQRIQIKGFHDAGPIPFLCPFTLSHCKTTSILIPPRPHHVRRYLSPLPRLRFPGLCPLTHSFALALASLELWNMLLHDLDVSRLPKSIRQFHRMGRERLESCALVV